MKKPWQIWAAFGLCCAVVLVGMAWLTMRALDLDRAELAARRAAEEAHRSAELQERIAMALWRMDWTMAPLIAQEVTRPSYTFQPFLEVPPGKEGKSHRWELASPLLTQPSDLVVLNFDVSPDNAWTSPQNPAQVDMPDAIAAGVAPETMIRYEERLRELRGTVTYQQLLTQMPETLLPPTHPSPPSGNTPNVDRSPDDAKWSSGYAGQQSVQQILPQQPAAQYQQGASVTPPAPQPPGQMARSEFFERQQMDNGQASQSRDFAEWERRNSGVQNVARSQRAQLMTNSLFMPDADSVREGVSRPVWIGSRLILARRVVADGTVRIQGSWLDWARIKRMLQDEVADLFPEIELLPVTGDSPVPPGRLLATLPVQLSLATTSIGSRSENVDDAASRLSAIKISLLIAWCCLLLGAVAVAAMLRGVLILSERRAAFVSAVTHELRSPLTTFRMYAEMLAEGMVRDDAQRAAYLETLRVEADRLSHLVDNVLQYARLERGRGRRRRIAITVKTLMQQSTERLPQRARQAGMELHETVTPQDAARRVVTDPSAVEQILFNLVDNACKYASSAEDRRIHLHWSIGHRVALIRVTDHGPGISDEQAKRLFHPFSKTDQEAAQSAPGIGLGLALCQRLASDVGGRLLYDFCDGAGAAFLLELPLAG